jgi:hypothetical protein
MTVVWSIVNDAVGEKNWKEAREYIPRLKERVSDLEDCSALRLDGARSRIFSLEREIERYDWPKALGDISAMIDEVIYDVACRKKRKE